MTEQANQQELKLYTPKEVATHLRCTQSKIHHMANAGAIRHLRIGRSLLFTQEHLDHMFKSFQRGPENNGQAQLPGHSDHTDSGEIYRMVERSLLRAGVNGRDDHVTAQQLIDAFTDFFTTYERQSSDQ